MIVPLDRLEAVLIAGAAGDCIGGPFEGHPADVNREVPPPPWNVSDDTRLTFATCRGIAKAPSIDPAAIADEFVREYHRGLPGVGSSTLKALRDLAAGQHWALAGARGEFAAGNGPAMRAAPLAFCGDVSNLGFRQTVRDVARITHCNDEAAAGALAVVVAMQRLSEIPAFPRDRLFRDLLEVLPDTALSDSLAMLLEFPLETQIAVAAQRVGTSGRTAQSVALAIFIGSSAVTIEEAIVGALRAGGDTDTIAAVAAQLRAVSGETLPPSWEAHLPGDEVRALAGAFVDAVGRRGRDARRPWWKIF